MRGSWRCDEGRSPRAPGWSPPLQTLSCCSMRGSWRCDEGRTPEAPGWPLHSSWPNQTASSSVQCASALHQHIAAGLAAPGESILLHRSSRGSPIQDPRGGGGVSGLGLGCGGACRQGRGGWWVQPLRCCSGVCRQGTGDPGGGAGALSGSNAQQSRRRCPRRAENRRGSSCTQPACRASRTDPCFIFH
jgi:hypothetical protein